jgi:hypothetical protein
MDIWVEIRARIERRAWKSRPVGMVGADRPAVRRVGDPQPGWEDNGLLEDISVSAGTGMISLIGLDFVVGGSVVE